MNSGVYTAYSGMQAQVNALDIIANNLANVNTTGFKEEIAFFDILQKESASESNENILYSTINRPVTVKGSLNGNDGSMIRTYRDLDIAIEGNGFMVLETPRGIRYSRNGNLKVNSHGILSANDGSSVIGDNGKPITLGTGEINIKENGDVRLDGTSVGKMKIVRFDNLSALEKEGNSFFLSRTGRDTEIESNAIIKAGYLEQSNVNPVLSVVRMISILRNYESIQKSMNIISNDINKQAIEKLSR